MVECVLAKDETGVRFSLPAQALLVHTVSEAPARFTERRIERRSDVERARETARRCLARVELVRREAKAILQKLIRILLFL